MVVKFYWKFVQVLLIIHWNFTQVQSFKASIRLYQDLMNNRDYNKLIRPVTYNKNTLTVYLGLKLSQLSEVNIRSQIVTTNLWIEQIWVDYNLKWNPDKYSGVKKLYIPSNKIWLPDIVLFNNADGRYEITIMTKAAVYYTGLVKWMPPAVYKSSCQINVEFFPYDIQECFLVFASWTYDGRKMSLKHMAQRSVENVPANHTGSVSIDFAVDLTHFYESVEFDILELSAHRTIFGHTADALPRLTFRLLLRRKTLFYTVNLMFPCLVMSFLSVLAFYLPSLSGEKVYLSITILFSLTLFFLVLVETIPSTSLVIPLIGKYLLFTMILISLSIIITVLILNVHFRSAETNDMPVWVRKTFLETLPKILFLDRPQPQRGIEYTNEKNILLDTFKKTPNSSATNRIKQRGSLIDSTSGVSNNVLWMYRCQIPQSNIINTNNINSSSNNKIISTAMLSSSASPFKVCSQMSANHISVENAKNTTTEMRQRRITHDFHHQQQHHHYHITAAGTDPDRDRPQCSGYGIGNIAGASKELSSSYFPQRCNTFNQSLYQQHQASTTISNTDFELDNKIERSVDEVEYVANHMQSDDNSNQIKEDWKFVSMVIDRLFLWTFSLACLISTMGIILQSPALYDNRPGLSAKNFPNQTTLRYALHQGEKVFTISN